MDNSVIHWCQKSKATIERLKLMVQLLPPYSPNLALAELVFALTKRKLLFKKESNEINFGRNNGKISIIESPRAVDSL